jgi:hypothetical protein
MRIYLGIVLTSLLGLAPWVYTAVLLAASALSIRRYAQTGLRASLLLSTGFIALLLGLLVERLHSALFVMLVETHGHEVISGLVPIDYSITLFSQSVSIGGVILLLIGALSVGKEKPAEW